MSNNRTQILAQRVIQQMLADRRTLALIVIVPMILLSFLGILIRHDQAKLVVAYINNDEGFSLAGNEINLGDRLETLLADIDEFNTEIMTAEEARLKLDDGDIDAAITVPEDFTANVASTRKLALAVEFEGSNPMLSERLEKLFERLALQSINTLAATGTPTTVPVGADSMEFETAIDATYLHGGKDYDTLDYMAPALVGFFVFFFTFLLTCISFLRERMNGTLERLQATPIRSYEIILGYMLGFLVFGLAQGAITLLFTVYALKIHYAGNLLNMFIVEGLLVAVSVNLGVLLSTFAQNEFQVLQFLPLVVVSQGLLGGVIWQIEDMPKWIQPISYLMPLTYGNQALRGVMIKGESLLNVGDSLLIITLMAAIVIVLASRTAGRTKI
ncbi:MAG: ABC-2 transporter permease [Anaerolineae bacterium]|nr:ABC-2 transporter permease [Anaerolineae bacterium]